MKKMQQLLLARNCEAASEDDKTCRCKKKYAGLKI